jgi:hypothetical protein
LPVPLLLIELLLQPSLLGSAQPRYLQGRQGNKGQAGKCRLKDKTTTDKQSTAPA